MTKCKLEDCPNPVTGRQTYCADRCRQRARKGSRALRYRRGQNRQISLSQPIEPIKEFQPTCSISDFARKLRGRVIDLVGTDLLPDVIATEREALKPVPASAYKHLDLVQVNSCTWKVVDPKSKTDVPAKLGHWAGYRTTKALAWVINLGYGQWIARCGNDGLQSYQPSRSQASGSSDGRGRHRRLPSLRPHQGVPRALGDYGGSLCRGVPGINAKAGRC
jgi:hypothetical protein